MIRYLKLILTTFFMISITLSISVYILKHDRNNGIYIKNYSREIKPEDPKPNNLDKQAVLGEKIVDEIAPAIIPSSGLTRTVKQIRLDTESQVTVHQIEDLKYSKVDFHFNTKADTSRTISVFDRQLSYSNPNNDREVMGFVPYWSLSGYKSLQYDKLSSISYFSLTCYDNGQWVTNDSGYAGFNSSNFTNMVNLAHQNNVRVYLVVKNFHNRSIRDLVANTGGAGDTLINNIVNVVRANNLDGVNVDFEYIADATYPVTSSLRANFASWHDKLADRIHTEFPGSVVSTDVFGSSAVGTTAYDLTALGKTSLNYVMLMTYDYITTSCYDGKKIAPMSPLYGNNLYGTPNWNVSSHLIAAASQMPAGKVIMGIPYYGIDFIVKQSDFSKYNALVNYPSCDGGIETYGSIVDPQYDQWHNSNTIKWNDTEKATWYAYNYNGQYRHGYYDDANSLRAKYDFVRSVKLGGIGIWVLGYDGTSSDLYNVMREKFQVTPFITAFKTSVSESGVNTIMSGCYVAVVDQIGDNVWRVKPTRGLSSTAIACLKKYIEVQVAQFENVNVGREISN